MVGLVVVRETPEQLEGSFPVCRIERRPPKRECTGTGNSRTRKRFVQSPQVTCQLTSADVRGLCDIVSNTSGFALGTQSDARWRFVR
jgi:hypothetical protein